MGSLLPEGPCTVRIMSPNCSKASQEKSTWPARGPLLPAEACRCSCGQDRWARKRWRAAAPAMSWSVFADPYSARLARNLRVSRPTSSCTTDWKGLAVNNVLPEQDTEIAARGWPAQPWHMFPAPKLDMFRLQVSAAI